jgi:hypothetical protein
MRWIAIVLCLAASIAHADDDALLAKAEAALRQGDGKAVVDLLGPEEEAHAGQARFDYLMGTGRLLAGQTEQASIELERAVAVEPAHAAAHLELGRAYFMLGNDDRALEEFDFAAKLNPPANASAVIEHYRKAIAERRASKRVKLAGHVEVTAGYDSNINNATSLTEVPIPALNNLEVSLSSANVRTADSFHTLTGAGSVDVVLSDEFKWSTNASAQHRDNDTKQGFDLSSEEIFSGVAYQHGTHSAEFGVLGGRVYLVGALNRRVEGLSLDMREKLWDSTQLASVTQYLRYRFPQPDLNPNSFNQVAESLGLTHTLASGRGALSANLLLGWEDDTDQRPDGKKRSAGMDFGFSWVFDEHNSFYSHLTYTNGRYGTENAVFLLERHDLFYYAGVGAVHTFGDGFSIRPELTYTRNNSNLPIYDYKDITGSMNVRYDF